MWKDKMAGKKMKGKKRGMKGEKKKKSSRLYSLGSLF